jgi:hypothetical protein
MAKRNWMLGGVLLFSAFALHAQDQSKNTQNKTAAPAQQASGGQDADTTRAKAGTASDIDATSANKTNGNETGARASSTPAGPQTTTSQGGSPAVLSGKKGSDRDGTNNVQRASMNMAGSPAAGLKLDQNNSGKVDAEARDRQQYSQDKARSAQNQDRADGSTVPGTAGSKPGQINNNNRKENNALSDQNLSAKEKKLKGKSEDKKSAKKKSKG